ncbi:MAG: 23S rRNA (uracil(1939)-C(5))-methyltransferase RlmD [Geobacteraceae bacterium]|nr:23S rRNA (uracil(1939)-C(5))-methyltransferase RlmD [Geobacteraceae bacterium]
MPEILIDRLAFGGSGFGRLDGKACFVPFTTPGDRVRISIEKDKKSYCVGIADEILSSSPQRILPQCPFFGSCGGCNWQQVEYAEQCKQKDNILAETLWRGARIDREYIKPILNSPKLYEYRQRIQLKAHYSNGRTALGFNRRSSHNVVDIGNRCAIASESLNAAIPSVREIIASFSDPAKIPQVDLSSSSDGSVSALFHYAGNSPEQLATHLRKESYSSARLHSISMQSGRKNNYRHIAGLQYLNYSVPSANGKSLDLYYSPDGFSQVNFAQNIALIEILTKICKSVPHNSILDLYCGNGNFSLPLACIAEEVTGYEYFDKSIQLAKYNASINTLSNAKYFALDSEVAVNQIATQKKCFDLVIIDPPRIGADIVSKKLHKTGASNLIYISCDPLTLSRDILHIKESGFEVALVQPVDMFPQTYHIESLVLLKAL